MRFKKNNIFLGKLFLLNQSSGLERIAAVDATDFPITLANNGSDIYGNYIIVGPATGGTWDRTRFNPSNTKTKVLYTSLNNI